MCALCLVGVSKATPCVLWRERYDPQCGNFLGHHIQLVKSSRSTYFLHNNELPSEAPSHSHVICDACQQGKSHQLPFSLSSRVTTQPLEIIYSDVWGPAQISTSGRTYYVNFIDTYSRFTWLYLLKHKSDVFAIFL
jgi:hypothetical protein